MYRTYRGSRGQIGCLIPTLVVLCICAALILLFLNKNLAFTSEGMTLSLPFSGREIVIGSSSQEQPPNLIIEPEIKETDPEPAAEISEPPPTRDEYETRVEKSVFIPLEVLLDSKRFDELYANLSSERVNTVILEVKADSGRLSFSSAAELAKTAGAGVVDNTALKNTLTKLTRDGYNVAAQLSCFRDNLAPRRAQAHAARTKNRVIWLDYRNITWLNPYTDAAQDYIIELIDEVYDLGFHEIILTNISFPHVGKTSLLYYSEEKETGDKQKAISGFISKLLEHNEDKAELRLSARHDLQPTGKEPSPGGQALSDLVDNFYRIYANLEPLENTRGLDSEKIDGYFDAIGETDFAFRFVPIISVSESDKLEDIFDYIYSAQSRGNGYALFNDSGSYPKVVISERETAARE